MLVKGVGKAYGKERMMEATSYGENLVRLTRYPRMFPINVYLVREDDGFTLVDTGISGCEGDILEAARGYGGRIRRIALTHAHGDHVGSLDGLREALPGVEVLITARDARFLRGDRSLDPGEPQDKPRGGYQACETRPTCEVSAGDRIGSLEVIASPGHTPGHVAFFDVRDRTLIAGDAFQTRGGVAVSGVWRPFFPFPAMATWHKPTALASARSLRALEPSRLAVGHGKVLEDPLPAMDRAIEVAERKAGSHAGIGASRVA